MTSKISIDNRELLQKISTGEAAAVIDFGNAIVRELAAFRLSAMDSEPVIIVGDDGGDALAYRRLIQSFAPGTKLYLHAQSAPVVPDDVMDALQKVARTRLDLNDFDGDCRGIADCLSDAEEALIEVVNRRAAMLQENAKSAGESNNCRRSEKVQDLLAGNCRENANSSTNNFREIEETSTGTAITAAAPDKKLTDDVLDEIIAGAKTAMEQHLALSLKAEREVWRKEGPTDDERIMAIEGMIGCLRCGDNGWVVGEMGITRCACGQAAPVCTCPSGDGLLRWPCPSHPGNSPAILDAARNALERALAAMEFMGDTLNNLDAVCSEDVEFVTPAFDAVRRVLAAAPQPQNEPQNIPEIIPQWIPVSERLPEDDDFVYIWPRPDFGVDLHVGQYCECSPKGEGWYAQIYEQNYGVDWHPITVTHWMPLPAAPQEPKS